MTRATALQHASQHRLARGLDTAQLATLVQHSRRNCERCDEYGSVYEQHTQGADPTTWQLCSLCHPSANTLSLWLDEGYADFLTEPQAPTYEAHVRLMHEEGGHWGFYEEMTPEEAIAPALASEQRRQAMLDEADGSEPELERLRRLPRQGEPTGPSKADIAAACEQLSRELSSPQMAAALERCDGLLAEEDARLSAEALARVPEGTSVRKAGAPGAGLVLRHMPFAGQVYVRWDHASGMRLAWENPADLTPIHEPCPNCDAPLAGKTCRSCGLEQL